MTSHWFQIKLPYPTHLLHFKVFTVTKPNVKRGAGLIALESAACLSAQLK